MRSWSFYQRAQTSYDILMDFLVLFPSGCFYVQKHIGQRFAITETTWLRVEVCFPIECFRLNPNYLWTLMLNLRFTKESVRSPLTLIDHWLWSGWLICFRPRTLRGTISQYYLWFCQWCDWYLCYICMCGQPKATQTCILVEFLVITPFVSFLGCFPAFSILLL